MMHSISDFRDRYVDPVIQHPAFQLTCLVVVEAIKIIAVKIFLEYLGQRFLSHPSLNREEVYTATVLAPLVEEMMFRLVVLQGIHLVQMILNDFMQADRPWIRIQVVSHVFENTIPQEEEGTFVIPVSPPIVEEMLFRGYLGLINGLKDLGKAFFNRIHLNSVFERGLPPSDSFCINMYLPTEQEILYHIVVKVIGIGKSIFNELMALDPSPITMSIPVELRTFYHLVMQDWTPPSLSVFTDEERRQQMVRIHLAAFLFAAAHLGNNHSWKVGAITQFVWCYISGISYGYLSEKYHSLAPGMLMHGLNNCIGTSVALYSEQEAPFILLALLVNKVGAYLLGMTFTQASEEE